MNLGFNKNRRLYLQKLKRMADKGFCNALFVCLGHRLGL